ncbi:MAG: leucine-rich repeat protein [Duncaniella sp.]|nr:leucine-rich repeat protein [Duncaniella sp.]
MGRIFIFLLACAVTLVTRGAVGDTFEADVFVFTVTSENPKEVSVASNRDQPDAINIPETVTNGGNTYTVTSIAPKAFRYLNKFRSLSMPSTVTEIGDNAFEGCDGLTQIIFSRNLRKIGNNAFAYCIGFSGFTIPVVEEFGTYVFSDCSQLQSVTLPSNMTSIPEGMFNNCTKLSNITLPEGLKTIGKSAFTACESLSDIKLPDGLEAIGEQAFGSCTSISDVVIPASLSRIDKEAFAWCRSLKQFEVASGNRYFSANDGVLYDYDKLNIIFVPYVKRSVNIPSSVTVITAGAFAGHTMLEKVTMGDAVTAIGEKAFWNCEKLSEIRLPETVTSIGKSAFASCSKLTEIKFPVGLKELGESAFNSCGLTTLTLPPLIKVIPERCFDDTKLTEVALPYGVTKIEKQAFLYCRNLTTIVLPTTVTSIGEGAFGYCEALTEMVVPEGVTELGNGVFNGCNALSRISLPASLSTLPPETFKGCSKLEALYDHRDKPQQLKQNVFDGVSSDLTIYVPRGAKSAYDASELWNMYFSKFLQMGGADLTLSQNTLSLMEGKRTTLKATVTKDADVVIRNQAWKSSDTDVAIIDAGGELYAYGAGSAVVWYSCKDDYGCPHVAVCTVTVTPDPSGIDEIVIDEGAEDVDAPAEYFNLHGVRVNAESLTPGIYIVRKGGKVRKVAINGGF